MPEPGTLGTMFSPFLLSRLEVSDWITLIPKQDSLLNSSGQDYQEFQVHLSDRSFYKYCLSCFKHFLVHVRIHF